MQRLAPTRGVCERHDATAIRRRSLSGGAWAPLCFALALSAGLLTSGCGFFGSETDDAAGGGDLFCPGVAVDAAFSFTTETEDLTFDPGDIAVATVEQVAEDEWIVAMTLCPEAAALFGAFTARHLGEPVGFEVAGETLIRPIISEPILDGRIEIAAGFDEGEAGRVLGLLRDASEPREDGNSEDP